MPFSLIYILNIDVNNIIVDAELKSQGKNVLDSLLKCDVQVLAVASHFSSE
jgi:hypothetical protein